ncbi:AraC family transcriptional regulator [Ferrimonas balearica]|uniref:AraC family transcriptional regulator n=1 Tax=Ferrimonas balearica TaxID=44012 RepID=UPI0021BD4999|nr:AraC family transcriptional regulator [Ferrimonas balearica]
MTPLAQLLDALAPEEGYNPTALPGVGVYRASTSRPREPLCYQQGIIIMAQGSKRVHLEDQHLDYDPDHYLVLTLPIPAECETRVKPGEPLLSLLVDIDLAQLNALVRLFDEHQLGQAGNDRLAEGRSLYVSPMTESFSELVLKLARALQSPLELAALGEGLVRELLFHLLQGAHAGPLFALARHNTHLARLERALKHLHDHFHRPLEVEQLASLANMSPSTFHRNFRQMTASSPIQYQKKLRLTRAKELLLDQGLKVKQAAAMVGYESPTQFSREFKRYFGQTPQHCAQGG